MHESPPLRALVLRYVNVGETDRILSVLTAERGRMELRVPQARRSRKRFGGLDLYVLAELRLSRRPGKPRLDAVDLIGCHEGIRADIGRLALAGYAADLLHQAAPEEQPSPELMRLAEAAFRSLDGASEETLKASKAHGWARGFELKLLHVLGNRPALRHCAGCGARYDPEDPPRGLRWSGEQGGLLVGGCTRTDPRSLSASPATISRLDEALHRPLSEQDGVRWRPAESTEARSLMQLFIDQHIGRRKKARAFLEQVLGPAVIALSLLLGGCPASDDDGLVFIQGWLYDSAAPDSDSEVVPGATLLAWADDGRPLGEGEEPSADNPGWYRMDGLPAESAVHLSFETPDPASWMSTVISGRSAPADLWVDAGSFHLWPRPLVDGWIDGWDEALPRFADRLPAFDPTIPDEGGMVRGRLVDPADHMGLRIVFVDRHDVAHPALYRDDEGNSILGTGTGATGDFAAFGIPAGPVEMRLFSIDGSAHARPFVTRCEEDAVTSLFGFVVYGE